MSWGLFVHNWRSSIPPPIRNTLTDGELETLFIDLDRTFNAAQLMRGLVTSDGNGKLAFVANARMDGVNDAAAIWTSDDYGVTWTENIWSTLMVTPLSPAAPLDSDSYITEIDRNPTTGRLYMCVIDLNTAGNRLRYDYFSDDFARTWTQYLFTTALPVSQSIRTLGLTLHVGADDVIFGGGRNRPTISGFNDTMYAVKAGTPGATSGFGTDEGPATTYDAVKLGGTYYVRTIVGSNVQIDEVNGTATTVIAHNNPVTSNFFNTLNWSETDGVRAFLRSTTNTTSNGIAVLVEGHDFTNVLPSIQLTFPSVAVIGDIGFHPDAGWVAVGYTTVPSTNSKIFVHYSADGITWSTTPLEWRVPAIYGSNFAFGGRMEVTYIGNDEWALAFRTNRLDLFSTVWLDRPALMKFTCNAL